MTHDILHSDIALATRLMGDHRSDQEILQALAYRGVDPAKVAKLLDDLHNGRKPEVQSPLPSEMTMRRRSRSRSSTPPASSGSLSPSQELRSSQHGPLSISLSPSDGEDAEGGRRVG